MSLPYLQTAVPRLTWELLCEMLNSDLSKRVQQCMQQELTAAAGRAAQALSAVHWALLESSSRLQGALSGSYAGAEVRGMP